MSAVNRFRLSGNPFDRPASGVVEPKAVIFLSTEGTKTEPSYFYNLQTAILEGHRDFPYVIHVLEHNRDWDSDPRHVLELLEECKAIRDGTLLLPPSENEMSIAELERRYVEILDHPECISELERRDFKDTLTRIGINIDYHRWLRQVGRCDRTDIFAIVIDRDADSHSRQVLAEIRSVCKEKGIVFCISNPCFELWLLLHVLDASSLSDNEKTKLSENRSVSRNHTYTSRLLSNLCHISDHVTLKCMRDILLPNVLKALQNAKTLDEQGRDVLDHLGTTIPELIAKFQQWLP